MDTLLDSPFPSNERKIPYIVTNKQTNKRANERTLRFKYERKKRNEFPCKIEQENRNNVTDE